MPCIDLGKNGYLPMEFCRTELKTENKFTDAVNNEIIKRTAVRAPDRMAYIESWAKNSNIDQDPILKQYNINIDLRLIEVDGRVLEAPDVKYGLKSIESKSIGEKGYWKHYEFRLVNGVNIVRWVVLNFSGRVKDDGALHFCRELAKVGSKHGLNISKPLDYAEPRNIRYTSLEEARRLFDDIYTKHKKLDLVLVIFDGKTQVYNMIKTCSMYFIIFLMNFRIIQLF